MKGIAETKEVVFSIEIVSLPIGGTMTRIACGKMMRRKIVPRGIPSAVAASHWPLETLSRPARIISARYAPSLRPRPMNAIQNGVKYVAVSNESSQPHSEPRKGTPKESVG